MIKQAYASLRAGIRAWGLAATLAYFANNVLGRCSAGHARVLLYRLQILPVPERNVLPPHRGRQFEIRAVLREDPVLAQLPRPVAVIQARYEQGSRCYCAFHNGTVVGQLWLQFDSYLEDEVRSRFQLSPASEVAWDYDVYVAENYRLTPLFARLWDEAFTQLRQAGKRWSASRVAAWNTASLQSHRRMGAQDVGWAWYLVIGKLQLMVSSLRPHLHIGASRNSVPVIVVEVLQAHQEIRNATATKAAKLGVD